MTVAALARAVLHEGLLLYPYRMSAAKNVQRFTFGSVLPRDFVTARDTGDRWHTHAEVLVRGGPATRVAASVHYLLTSDDEDYVHELGWRSLADEHAEALPAADLSCQLKVMARPVADHDGLHCLQVALENLTTIASVSEHDRQSVLRWALGTALIVLRVEEGSFVSATDPPAALRGASEALTQDGLWPVLVGAEGSADCVLAAPIILPDHPQLAPESPGDLFDATEIDELLTLRILTLTDDEKEAMRREPRARRLLERSEELTADELMALHGRLARAGGPAALTLADGTQVRPGDSVILRPASGRRGDVMDLTLAGRRATVLSLEEELEGGLFAAVAVDGDPGRDLAIAGHPGHRFFFRAEELEAVASPRVLIACLGNVFHGDDGFGVEVAKLLAARDLPDGVDVIDYGIRAYDLALALLERRRATILVDAAKHPDGQSRPGRLFVLEDLRGDQTARFDPHALGAGGVLALATRLGARLDDVYLVGCEPELVPTDELAVGLTKSVAGSVVPAAERALALAKQLLSTPPEEARGT